VPAWSADGQQLAFTRATPADCGSCSSRPGRRRRDCSCGDRAIGASPGPRRRGRSLPARRRQALAVSSSRSRRSSGSASRTRPAILGAPLPSASSDGGTLALTRNITGRGRVSRPRSGGGRHADFRQLTRWDPRGRKREEPRLLLEPGGYPCLWRVPASGRRADVGRRRRHQMKHPSTARAREMLSRTGSTRSISGGSRRPGAEPSAASA
jgi:hypothetical protein